MRHVKNPDFNSLAKRTVSGAVVAAVVVGSLFWSRYSFSALLAVIAGGALWEFYSIGERAGTKPQKYPGIIIGVLAVLSYGLIQPFSTQYGYYWKIAVLILAFVVFIIELYRNKENPLLNIAVTLMGLVYIAVPLGLFNYINFLTWGPYSRFYLLGFIVLIWANDVGAYLVGVAFGRRKLFERISPKKSWEGFFGGLLIACGTGVLIQWAMGKYFFNDISFSLYWVGLAIVVVISGVFGDLVESMLKRSVLLKDSGDVIPGHGGFLDRFDALIFSVPFVYLYFLIFGFYN